MTDSSKRGQLELPIERELFQDRNADRGGRSFYFFDFDDNVAFLSSPVFLFHKETGAELALTSGEFAAHHRHVGESGLYRDYQVIQNDLTGTFRRFRDRDIGFLSRLLGKRQFFVEDLAAALGFPDVQWKGPSWSCFYHAALNNRPAAVITARGHKPQTIKDGVKFLVQQAHLPAEPNYVGVYPVTHPSIRAELGDPDAQLSVAALKKLAIQASVENAFKIYQPSPFHRFGMSDDDPHNIELIVEAFTQLKAKHPQNSFFVIETSGGKLVKWEVFADHVEPTLCAKGDQVEVMEQLSLIPKS